MPAIPPAVPPFRPSATPAPSGPRREAEPDPTVPAPRGERPLDLSLPKDFASGFDPRPFDPQAFDQVWKKDLLPRLTAKEKAGFVIQELRYADLVAGGRETTLLFEHDPGNLMPPTGLVQDPWTDPITGQTHLALRQARIRVSAGRYDLMFKVDGDGRPSFDKLYLDGRNVTKHAADYVKAKIKEEPWVWGPVAGAGALGLVALAHAQAGKTGEPIGFNAVSVTPYKSENWEVKAKLRGELTGDSSFVRAGGAEIGTYYHDERLSAGFGARYTKRTEAVELAASMTYQVDRDSTFSASASYNSATKDRAIGLHYQSRF